MDADKLHELFRALERERVEYVVVGAIAINLLGLPRATEDRDRVVRPTGENVDRLRRALRAVWDDPELADLSAEDLAGDYAVIRYGPPEGGIACIDLSGHVGEAFRFEDLRAEVMEVAGVAVPVATPATLYRMKRGTLRLKDRADAELLRERFPLVEEE
jgi:hypothetical protein